MINNVLNECFCLLFLIEKLKMNNVHFHVMATRDVSHAHISIVFIIKFLNLSRKRSYKSFKMSQTSIKIESKGFEGHI